MKLAKYIIAVVILILIAIVILTRLPSVQDRVMIAVVKDVMNSSVDLHDDSLTALVCGSRAPLPHPNRAEACILINAGGNYYVVDVGDGSVSNLRDWRIDGSKIKATLLTHLHSDHIADLADLHLATWIAQSRPKKLDVFGPTGVELVTQGLEDAYQLDYQYRNEHHGNEVAPLEVVGFDPHPIDLSLSLIHI